MDAAAARRQHGVDVVAVEQGADAVAVAREQARQHGDELARDGALGEAVGAEVDARREVDQEPRRELAVLGELAHVRRLQPRGDVPVDVADVVVVLVLAQVGEVEAGAAHQRAVVALQHAVEAAQDRPLHALEERLGAVVIDQRVPASQLRPWLFSGASGLSGTGILRITFWITASASMPSASASYERTRRWRSTSPTRPVMSSGRA